MQLETLKTMEKGEVVEGKVDWKGRPARKGKHGGSYSALLVLAAFGLENFASIANAVNLVTYFNGVMHFDIAEAANIVTNFSGTGYLLAVAVGFLADSYTGRYKTAVIIACIETLGYGLMAVQAHYPHLKPPPCIISNQTTQCEKIGGSKSALLFISLYLTAVGSAGVKSCMPPHGADQFDEKDPREVKQMSSYFNWILLCVCLGAFTSLTFIVWIQVNRGWDIGFGMMAIAMILCIVVFVYGIPSYRIPVTGGTNPITEVIQVFVAAFRNRTLPLPESPEELYEHESDKESTTGFEHLPHRDILRFLDKAAIPQQTQQLEPSKQSPWQLCGVTQVENAKIILSMIPIFLSTITMSTCLAQLQTFSVQQGITMDTHVIHHYNIPPASLPVIPIIFMIILIPIYDRLFVPFARRITGHPTGITHLQRIAVGLVLSSISMAAAAIVEVKRKSVARDNGMLDAAQPLPISVFWLSIQYFIFGIADMFTYVGLLEFFYSEAPKAMKSISTSFLWCSMALGYFLSTVLVQVVNHVTKGFTKSGGWLGGNNLNRNHLNLFYWLLSILSLMNFFNYLFWARWYKYRPQPGKMVANVNEKV